MKQFSEADLYEPIKKYFTRLGYEVYGEVKSCDVVAVKEGEKMAAIELKKSFNLKLVYQLLERKAVTDCVYAAIPRPKGRRGREYNSMLRLLKALGIGLITVAVESPIKTAEVLLTPADEAVVRKNYSKKAAIAREISGRSSDYNTGGVHNTKINTAYREKCIQLACILERHGSMSARYMVERFGCAKDTNLTLRNNVYGWFMREEKGIYALSEQGRDALFDEECAELVRCYRKWASEK